MFQCDKVSKFNKNYELLSLLDNLPSQEEEKVQNKNKSSEFKAQNKVLQDQLKFMSDIHSKEKEALEQEIRMLKSHNQTK